ncbi:MAG: IspD/TarI family cytidylyltransferase, partial [Planctomycetota bacterium]
MKKTSVIICAAGSSTRFGGDRKKPFVELNGRAAFIRSIEFFAERDDVCQVIVAISPEDEEIVKVKWGAALAFNGVKLCFGGAERFETVAKALELVKDEAELIAVHDAVRCCLTKDWLD